MTTYRPTPNETVTLTAENVRRGIAGAEREAQKWRDRLPTREEAEGGLTRQGICELGAYARKELERRQNVLAAVEAGTPELPAKLYHDTWHGR